MVLFFKTKTPQGIKKGIKRYQKVSNPFSKWLKVKRKTSEYT